MIEWLYETFYNFFSLYHIHKFMLNEFLGKCERLTSKESIIIT